jgi:DNA-binding CsgD family transcriptional regulator
MSPNSFLTPREMDILAFVIAGKRNREIAAALNLSVGTVKSYLSSICRKLGVSSRTQAAIVGLGIFPMLLALANNAGRRFARMESLGRVRVT